MMKKEDLIKKITSKKEFSNLPKKDVKLVFSKFDKENLIDEEKIKLTRDLLRKVYTVFLSQKLLGPKSRNMEWFLKKHLSSKERLSHYKKVYEKALKGFGKNVNIFDLGCGVNGFSYPFFSEAGFDVDYTGYEAVGQLVKLQSSFFKKNPKVNFVQGSLFDLEKVKKVIKDKKGAKIVLLFKVLDSLEMVKKDYSKKLIWEAALLSDRVVVSFAVRSLSRRRKFFAKRVWIKKFLSENFDITDEFEAGGEKYVSFSKKGL